MAIALARWESVISVINSDMPCRVIHFLCSVFGTIAFTIAKQAPLRIWYGGLPRLCLYLLLLELDLEMDVVHACCMFDLHSPYTHLILLFTLGKLTHCKVVEHVDGHVRINLTPI